MSAKPINDVLAENLAYFMSERDLTQQDVAGKTGMGQTTVSLYLHPERRKISKSGKVPSAKLSEVEALSKILGIEIWQLLRPLDPEQRKAYASIEAAFNLLQQMPTYSQTEQEPQCKPVRTTKPIKVLARKIA